MKNIQKQSKNNQKTIFKVLLILIVFSLSCKKSETNLNVTNWDAKKLEIAKRVKANLDSVKLLLPYAISRVENGDISYNTQKIKGYFNISNTKPDESVIFSRPKNSLDLIDQIKTNKSSTVPNLENPENPIDEEDPYEYYTSSGFRNLYRIATENFTDLNSYLTTLTGISEDLIATTLIDEDDKVLMYTEIETLRQYAIDLETNPEFWLNLYAPQQYTQVSSSVQNNSIMAVGNEHFGGAILMGGNPANQGCKIDVRRALVNGIVGGFIAGAGYAKVGFIAGTVAVPGVGTVTGAVSGFMSGFAFGFIGGVVKSVVQDALLTCGR